MDDAQIRTLQADIQARLADISEVYKKIDQLGGQATGTHQDIVLAYYIQVLYGLFEQTFEQIALVFGNHIADKSQWHTQLLRRMSLDISPTRPAVISPETHRCLNELRAFRHLFRNAYLLRFDPDRLNIVLKDVKQLQTHYPTDFANFDQFLQTLTQP